MCSLLKCNQAIMIATNPPSALVCRATTIVQFTPKCTRGMHSSTNRHAQTTTPSNFPFSGAFIGSHRLPLRDAVSAMRIFLSQKSTKNDLWPTLTAATFLWPSCGAGSLDGCRSGRDCEDTNSASHDVARREQ